MLVYEKIYFKAYTNDQYISHKNNIEQLYLILKITKLCWNILSTFKDCFDIHRFSNRKYTVGNL